MSHFNEAGMDSSLTDFTAQNQVYGSILAGIVVCTSHGACSDVLGIPPTSHTYLNSLVQMMSLMMKKHIEGNICLMPAIRSQDRGGLCLVVYPMFMLLLGRHFSCGWWCKIKEPHRSNLWKQSMMLCIKLSRKPVLPLAYWKMIDNGMWPCPRVQHTWCHASSGNCLST